MNSVRKVKDIILIAFFLLSSFLPILYAEPKPRQFEMMTGYGIAHLPVEVEKHKIIPLIGRFYWEMRPGGFFGADIFYASVLEPSSEIEAGGGILWQRRYRNYRRISPYWEAGAGLIYTSLKTEEQATKGNLILRLGLGSYITLKENLKLDICYWLRHYSNGGIELPSIGINHYMAVFGLCWNF